MMDGEFFLKVLDKYGYPTVVLAVAAFFAWRLARWVSPMAKSILEAHVDGMDALKTNTSRTADAVEALSALMQANIEEHKKTQGLLGEVLDSMAVIAAEANIKIVPLVRRKPV